MQWFEKQHGPRQIWSATDAALQTLISQAKGAQEELDRRRDWDNRRQSALYAWAARFRIGNGL